MTYKNDEILQRLAQQNWKSDLNGALRDASGLDLDENGIARTLWGKEAADSYHELATLLGAMGTTGTFEAGLGAWTDIDANQTLAADATVSHSGTSSLKATRTADGAWAVYSDAADPRIVPVVTPGESISSSMWVRHNAVAAVSLRVCHQYYAGGAALGALNGPLTATPASTWTRFTFSTTVPPTATSLQIVFFSGVGPIIGESMWIDDVYLNRGGQPFDPSTGRFV